MPIVKFVNEKKEIEVPVGANLRQEAVKAGINLNLGVNGYGASINKYVNCSNLSFGLCGGTCGTCRVLITRGMENTSPLSFMEKFRLKTPILPDPIPCMAYIGNEDTMRLACQTKVLGDIEVKSGPEVNLFGENFFSESGDVKQIIAIVKPFLAEKVLEALKRAPLEALSVREVKGYGRQKSYLDQYGDSEYSLAFLPKVEITLWVDDSRVEEILPKIVAIARTGRMGDGKIMVLPVFPGEALPIAAATPPKSDAGGRKKGRK